MAVSSNSWALIFVGHAEQSELQLNPFDDPVNLSGLIGGELGGILGFRDQMLAPAMANSMISLYFHERIMGLCQGHGHGRATRSHYSRLQRNSL